jgi:hypothetical protein
MQMQSPAQRSLLQHIQLMPQHQNLGFELLTRLEVVAQHADEQEADCNHQRSCSDSLPTASHLDMVFGSDRGNSFFA